MILYLRQYRNQPWKELTEEGQEAARKDMARSADEGDLVLRPADHPLACVKLTEGFCYMWGTADE